MSYREGRREGTRVQWSNMKNNSLWLTRVRKDLSRFMILLGITTTCACESEPLHARTRYYLRRVSETMRGENNVALAMYVRMFTLWRRAEWDTTWGKTYTKRCMCRVMWRTTGERKKLPFFSSFTFCLLPQTSYIFTFFLLFSFRFQPFTHFSSFLSSSLSHPLFFIPSFFSPFSDFPYL